MKYSSTYMHPEGLSFIIDEDKNVGFYLYVYDRNGSNTHDYLQDDLETVKFFAFNKFDVPEDSWIEVDEQIA